MYHGGEAGLTSAVSAEKVCGDRSSKVLREGSGVYGTAHWRVPSMGDLS